MNPLRGVSNLAVFTAMAYFTGRRRMLLVVGLGVFAILLLNIGDPDFLDTLAATALVLAAAFAITITSGAFGTERDSGVAILFLQHPTSIVRLYGLRYLACQIVNLAAMTSVGLLLAIIATANGESFVRVVALLVTPIFLGQLVAAVTFAFGSMGVARDSLLALAFIAITTAVAAVAAITDLKEGRTSPVRRIGFPIDAFDAIADRLDPASVGVVLGHMLVWTALGFLALALWDRTGRGVKA